MSRHARKAAPEECCGILLGAVEGSERSRVDRICRAANVEERLRERAFTIAPTAVLAAEREARSAGLSIVGYYHSHPSGSARPSELDRERAWPETSYVIVGLGGGGCTVRSWRLNQAMEFEEEKLVSE